MKLTLTLTDGENSSNVTLLGEFDAADVSEKVNALNSLSSGYVVDHDLQDDVDVDLTIPVTTADPDSTARKNVKITFSDGTYIRVPGNVPSDQVAFLANVPASITNQNGDTLTPTSAQYSN